MSKPKATAVKIVKLTTPISWGEETITQLDISKPKGKHLRNVGQNLKLGELMDIAAACAGHPKSVMDLMDSDDAMACANAVADFLDGGQGIG